MPTPTSSHTQIRVGERTYRVVSTQNPWGLIERQLSAAIIFNFQVQEIKSQNGIENSRLLIRDIDLEKIQDKKRISDALVNLIGSVIIWNEGNIGDLDGWHASSFLNYAKIKNGNLELELNSSVIDQIRNPALN